MKIKISVIICVLLGVIFFFMLTMGTIERWTDQNIIKNVLEQALSGSFLTERSETIQKAFDSEIADFDAKRTLEAILGETYRVISMDGRILVINKERKTVEFENEFPFFLKVEVNDQDLIRALLFDH